MTVKERLAELIFVLKLKQYQFAKSLGVSPAIVSDWLKQDYKSPSVESLIKISQVHHVNLQWLLTGTGTMFIVEQDADPAEPSHHPVRSIPIEIVADIAAGYPTPAYEYEDRQVIHVPVAMLTRSGPYFGFKIAGESMQPLLLPDDLVIISRNWKGVKLNNCICAFRTGDGITIKRLVLLPRSKQGLLYPLNPLFNPLMYNPQDTDIELLGILILSFRHYNLDIVPART